jgi:RNA polymerase sigma-70 factor (ECF subfamily)
MMGNADEEMSTIASILSGEIEKFKDLVRPYERGLHAKARAILRNDADAEDAVQDAFIKAYRNLSRFRGDARFRTWLYAIALNEVRIRLRRFTSHRFESIDVGPGEAEYTSHSISDPSENPAEIMERCERRALLHEAIIRLPAKYRDVLHLREQRGLTVREAAAALAISPESVKTRAHRGREMLRKYLEPRLGSNKTRREFSSGCVHPSSHLHAGLPDLFREAATAILSSRFILRDAGSGRHRDPDCLSVPEQP